MKKDMKLGVNLMNKNVINEMIKKVTGLEVEIEMNVTDGLGNFFLYYEIMYNVCFVFTHPQVT